MESIIHESESHSVMSSSLQPHGLYSPWNSPGQNIAVSSCSLPQEIFPIQGLNPCLPHCRQILSQLSHQKQLSMNTYLFKYAFFWSLFLNNFAGHKILRVYFLVDFARSYSTFFNIYSMSEKLYTSHSGSVFSIP